MKKLTTILLVVLALCGPLLTAAQTIVGTPTAVANGGTVTVGAGANRLLVVAGAIKAGVAATITNGNYKSVTRSPVVTTGDSVNSPNDRLGVGWMIFTEAEIAAGGGAAFTITWTESQPSRVIAYTVQDADQASSVADSDVGSGLGTDGVAVTAISLTGLAADMLCLGVTALRSEAGVAQQNGWTEDTDAAIDPGGNEGRYSTAHFTATGTTCAYSIAPDGLDSSYAIAALAIKPVTAGASGPLRRRRSN